MSQVFRFCLRCVRVSLIKNGCCLFCKGDFIVKTAKDDILIKKQRDAAVH